VQACEYRALAGSATELDETDFVRDEYMAEHLAWIADRAAPGARIVLWAHNFHVGRIQEFMGAQLARRFGDDYRAIGLTFFDGEFRARTYDNDEGPYSAPTEVRALAPAPNCVESACHEVGKPLFFVDLRDMPPTGPDTRMRVVGWNSKVNRTIDDEFEPIEFEGAFDGLIYVEQTHALDMLDWPDLS
jgi:erythromycin esterase-like protein